LNSAVALANETARARYGALIFCSRRAGCESDALLINQVLPELRELADEVLERRKDLLNELRSAPTVIDHILEKAIPRGVAFHRTLLFSTNILLSECPSFLTVVDAGLATEERERVAEAYGRGVLKVIVATCSLAAGINLPARRVILLGARMGRTINAVISTIVF
jgi:replicative superfamily II helicase